MAPLAYEANEVRSIFRYIHGEESECKVDFKIIHSSANVYSVGTKTRELKDGLYLVCDTQRKDFPVHLRDIVVMNPPTKGNAYTWEARGLVKNVPIDLNGRRQTSYTKSGTLASKGGCIWTKVENGVDNKQYRILHVKSKQNRSRRSEGEEDNGCDKCGRNDKKKEQLQCSACFTVFRHVECAGLPAIPKGDWFCSDECERPGAELDLEGVDCEPALKESPGPTIQPQVDVAVASRPSNQGSNGVGGIFVPKHSGLSAASSELTAESSGPPSTQARAAPSSNQSSNSMTTPAPMDHGQHSLSMACNEESTNPLQNLPPTAYDGSITACVPASPGLQHAGATAGIVVNPVNHGTMLSQQQQARQAQQAQLQQAPGMFPMGMPPMFWNSSPPFPYLYQPQHNQQNLASVNTEPPQPTYTNDDRKRSADGPNSNARSKRAKRALDQGQPRPDRQESVALGTETAPLDVDKLVEVKKEENNDSRPVFYSLFAGRLETDDWTDVGFITAESHEALADLRRTIQNQLASELPDDWGFWLDKLGLVTPDQEYRLGPAKKLMRVGKGTPQEPFILQFVTRE